MKCPGLLLAAALAVTPAAAGETAGLDRLVGKWSGAGAVEGAPVRYAARGEWVLMGQFLRLTLVEDARNPAYEAQIFIAKSKTKSDLVAHWLDNFGADGARVVGFGAEAADGFNIDFAYGDRTFRDYFRFDADGRRFTLVVDSCAADGACDRFADYVFEKKR